MREFFGFGGYQRPAEGFLSRQHLLFATTMMVAMIVLAVFWGKKYAKRPAREKNRVLIAAAIAIDAFELFKIVLLCIRHQDPMRWLYNLPLFLCSIQLIALPLAAFTHGRMKEACLDFVFVFGVLGAVLALSVDSSADWISWQMTGACETSGGAYRIAAQRNAFDAKTGEAAARDAAARLAGTYASDGLTLSVQKTGVVRLSGKYAGKSVSGSSVLFYENGGFAAEYFIFVKNFGVLNLVVVFDEESGEVRWTVF